MKLLLAIFFIMAIVQMGFFGIYHYYHFQNLLRPSPYWMGSLLVSILGLFIFGAGIVTVQDVARLVTLFVTNLMRCSEQVLSYKRPLILRLGGSAAPIWQGLQINLILN